MLTLCISHGSKYTSPCAFTMKQHIYKHTILLHMLNIEITETQNMRVFMINLLHRRLFFAMSFVIQLSYLLSSSCSFSGIIGLSISHHNPQLWYTSATVCSEHLSVTLRPHRSATSSSVLIKWLKTTKSLLWGNVTNIKIIPWRYVCIFFSFLFFVKIKGSIVVPKITCTNINIRWVHWCQVILYHGNIICVLTWPYFWPTIIQLN